MLESSDSSPTHPHHITKPISRPWTVAFFPLLVNNIVDIRLLFLAVYAPLIGAFIFFLLHHDFDEVPQGFFIRIYRTWGWLKALVFARWPELRTKYITRTLFFCYGNTFFIGFTLFISIWALSRYLSWKESLVFGHQYQTSQMFLWFICGHYRCFWGLWFDWATITMMVVVSVVSFSVHLFSIDYMRHDPGLHRFFFYLSLFTFFMLLLVSASSIIQLFVGWEGVGLCSFLLISFWLERLAAVRCAVKAVIVNRIGDCALLVAIGIIYHLFGSLDNKDLLYSRLDDGVYTSVEPPSFEFGPLHIPMLDVAIVCLFVGVMAKSAQLGLHTWLPDAMEGPTPVSALIHAATMVTAGVFLMVRYAPVFSSAPPPMRLLFGVVGAGTVLVAGLAALTQTDLKRVIAYSTCSQLGYMVMACAQGSYAIALYHLMTHAFYKALLFLSAGAIIHYLADEQDMRRMGRIRSELPLIFWLVVFASCSLAGLPFFGGFFSKDAIINAGYWLHLIGDVVGTFIYGAAVCGAFLTGAYSFRLIYLVFMRPRRLWFWLNTLPTAPVSPYSAWTTLLALLFLGVAVMVSSSYYIFDLFRRLNMYPLLHVNSTLHYLASFQAHRVFQDKAALLTAHPPAALALLPLLFVLCGGGLVWWQHNPRKAPAVATGQNVSAVVSQTHKEPVLRVLQLELTKSLRGHDEFGRLWGELVYCGGYRIFKLLEAGWLSYLGPIGSMYLTWQLNWAVSSFFPLRIAAYANYWLITCAVLIFLFVLPQKFA